MLGVVIVMDERWLFVGNKLSTEEYVFIRLVRFSSRAFTPFFTEEGKVLLVLRVRVRVRG